MEWFVLAHPSTKQFHSPAPQQLVGLQHTPHHVLCVQAMISRCLERCLERLLMVCGQYTPAEHVEADEERGLRGFTYHFANPQLVFQSEDYVDWWELGIRHRPASQQPAGTARWYDEGVDDEGRILR